VPACPRPTGYRPGWEPLRGRNWQAASRRRLAQDNRGFLLTGSTIRDAELDDTDRLRLFLATSRPGIFAVGDVRSGTVKRAATAIREGALAVRLVSERLLAGRRMRERGSARVRRPTAVVRTTGWGPWVDPGGRRRGRSATESLVAGRGLAVAPKSPRQAVQMNKDIREAVQKELEFDPLVDATGITLKNMNGDVALNGTVPSYPQYLQAAAAARRVQGVTRVHNHLMVDLPVADYRDDPMLTTAANNALAMSVTVPGSVEASASEGNVWLTGMVGNRFERDAAENAVAGLTGVRGIADDIEIFSDIEAADVTDLVQDALFRYGLFPDESDVRVGASDGTVILTGHVSNWAEHGTVIDAAWRGVGVRNVRDDLVVTG
jgi:osmotically-inducible protein OsmY